MFREGRSVKMRSLWNRSWRLLPRENWVRLGNGRLTSPRRNRKEDLIPLKPESAMVRFPITPPGGGVFVDLSDSFRTAHLNGKDVAH